MNVPAAQPRALALLAVPRSRRSAIHAGGTLLAGLGALALPRTAAAQATPMGGGDGGDPLLVQSFSQGSLFPTQGDVGVLPYTVILWDAADRGFFFVDEASGAAGVVATATVMAAIEAAGAQPLAVLFAPAAEDSGSVEPSEAIWALRLGYGAPGSDPGAVTYQGEPLPADEAAALLGVAPADLPEGALDLRAGYLIITGLSGFDPSDAAGLTLHLR